MRRDRDLLSRNWNWMPKCTSRRRRWPPSSSWRQMSGGTTANPHSLDLKSQPFDRVSNSTPKLPACSCHRLDPCQRPSVRPPVRFSRSRSACWKLCHAAEVVCVLAIEALKSAAGRQGEFICSDRQPASHTLRPWKESGDVLKF